jgi:predicted transcriptional regulator
MRTTVRINDDLLKEAKAVALATDRTLTELVEDALREALARRRASAKRERIVLPTSKGRLLPGVDLRDSVGLLDIMEGPDADPRRQYPG